MFSNARRVVSALLGALALGGLGACSSAVTPPPEPYGIQHVVEKANGSRPQWIDEPGKYQKDHSGKRFFVGLVNGDPDMESGRTDAEASASAELAKAIENTVHDLYVKGRTTDQTAGNSDLERAIESGTIQQARALATGLSPQRFWWEKYWVQSSSGAPVRYYYNVWVLSSMSKANFDRTIYQTLNGLRHTVSAPHAKKVVKEMKKLYLKQSQP
ncbi:MAG: hypothetical protein ACYCTV_10550 [Leptospirales bacterium]